MVNDINPEAESPPRKSIEEKLGDLNGRLVTAINEGVATAKGMAMPPSVRAHFSTELTPEKGDKLTWHSRGHQIYYAMSTVLWPRQKENHYLRVLSVLYAQKLREIWEQFESHLDTAATKEGVEALADELYKVRSSFADHYNHSRSTETLETLFTLGASKGETFALPSLYGLALMASYLEEKYTGSSLSICTPEMLEEKLESMPSGKSFGIMLIKPQVIHITPLIGLKQENGTLQLVDLESTIEQGNSLLDWNDFSDEGLGKKLRDKGVDVFHLSVTRQADRLSCRADALSILSNALWDIERKHIRNLHELPEFSEERVRDGRVILPPAWAKTVQRAAALKDVDLKAAVRTKKADKTLGGFMAAHSEDVEGETLRRYLNQKGKKYFLLAEKLVTNKDKYPAVWARYRAKIADLERQKLIDTPSAEPAIFENRY